MIFRNQITQAKAQQKLYAQAIQKSLGDQHYC